MRSVTTKAAAGMPSRVSTGRPSVSTVRSPSSKVTSTLRGGKGRPVRTASSTAASGTGRATRTRRSIWSANTRGSSTPW